VRGTLRDNTASLTRFAVEVTGSDQAPAQPFIHRNDFTDYVDALLVTGTVWDGFAPCNYWGPTGPRTGTKPSYYTPYSTVPIANRPSVTCP
jgi:hypothetical protein